MIIIINIKKKKKKKKKGERREGIQCISFHLGITFSVKDAFCPLKIRCLLVKKKNSMGVNY